MTEKTTITVKTNQFTCHLNKENIRQDYHIEKFTFDTREDRNQAYSLPYEKYGILAVYAPETKKGIFLYAIGKKSDLDVYRFNEALQEAGIEGFSGETVFVTDTDTAYDRTIIRLLFSTMGAYDDLDSGIHYGNYIGRLYASNRPLVNDEQGQSPHGVKIEGDTIVFNRIQYTESDTLVISIESWMPYYHVFSKYAKKTHEKRFVMRYATGNRALIRVPWDIVTKERNAFLKEQAHLLQGQPKDRQQDILTEKAKTYKAFTHWYILGNPYRYARNREDWMSLATSGNAHDKLSVMYRFLFDIQQLSAYITLTPQTARMIRYPVQKEKKNEKQKEAITRRYIETYGLTILGDKPEQKEEAKRIAAALRETYPDLPPETIRLADAVDKTSLNLQVLYEKRGYRDTPDPYQTGKTICLQHYTIPLKEKKTKKTSGKISGREKAKIHNAVHELIIKKCLIDRKMPPEVRLERDIEVVYAEPMYEDGTRTPYDTRFYHLVVRCTGEIQIYPPFLESDYIFSDGAPEQKLIDAYAKKVLKAKQKSIVLEGLIRADGGHYYGIYRTTVRPLPDYLKLQDAITRFNQDREVSVKQVMAWLEAYCRADTLKKKKPSPFCEIKEKIAEQIEGCEQLSFNQFRVILKEASEKKYKGFANFLKKETDGQYLISFPGLKASGAKNPFHLDHVTGIAYRKIEGGWEYYAGLRSVHSISGNSLAVSVPIRILECEDDYDFEKYAALLDVTWVREGTGAPTVIPWPFKLLRESIAAQEGI